MSFQRIDKETFPQLFNSPLYVKILSLIGTGGEQGVNVRDISRATELDDRGARRAIEAIRRAGVVICADCLHGYYYPETLEELERYVRQEERRGRSTFFTLKSARRLYRHYSKEASG